GLAWGDSRHQTVRPLANFTAKITSTLTVDDGKPPALRFYELTISVARGRTYRLAMSGAEFVSMAWVRRLDGAVLHPGGETLTRFFITGQSLTPVRRRLVDTEEPVWV